MGTAMVQGKLWGSSPKDWAQVCESLMAPLHEGTLAALAPLGGLSVLDAGCGSGQALALAAKAGARVTGLDASAPLLDFARERVPDADLRVGDIEEMPFADAAFDVVTAFNSIQYASDPKNAVVELARVTKPEGRVAIGVWGEPAKCETEVVFARVRQIAPPPPGAPAPLAVSTPGVVEDLLDAAGLAVEGTREIECPFVYPDLATAWRGMGASGPFRKAIETAGEDAVREAFFDAHAPYRRPDGSYRQENVFRYVIARKSS